MGAERERGQAAVELVCLLPCLVLVALAGWQLAVGGFTWWSAGSAVRAAARAQAVGADPRAAAARALPARLERGMRISPARDGSVSLSVGVPAVAGSGRLATISLRSHFAPQQGQGTSGDARP